MSLAKRVGWGILICLAVLIIGGSLFRVQATYKADQAMFNVDVLGKFIQIYKDEYQQYPAHLRGLHHINVVSYLKGLGLNSSDFNPDGWRGYVYHYKVLDDQRFVLSASPVGALRSAMEFGITDKGVLYFNFVDVDAAADSYEEVERWMSTQRDNRINTIFNYE